MKIALLAIASIILVGCGEKGPDPKVEANRVEAAKMSRELFNKVNGNYEQLTPADKAALLEQFGGDEAKAKTTWDFMKMQGQTGMPGSTTGGN